MIQDDEVCGVSFDHDLREIASADGCTSYECRFCGAEIYEEATMPDVRVLLEQYAYEDTSTPACPMSRRYDAAYEAFAALWAVLDWCDEAEASQEGIPSGREALEAIRAAIASALTPKEEQ